MLSPGTILQNRYRIVRELGHGGMGTIYEAVDQRVNCVVALKQAMIRRGSPAQNAFQHEAALLANLRHPSLTKVTDYFSENDRDFLVMEFIPGYDLAELLDLRGGPFPQSQVVRWAYELLLVLEYLHGQEPPILHRDIKPSNLKLTKAGEIFLLDFGLAKGSAGQMPTVAADHSVYGYTPIYASLEQILSSGTDARSDIYSLGATLYHLITGVTPIDAPRRFQQIEDGEADPLQPIQKLNPHASQNVVAVIHQAMAMNQDQRHKTAAEMRKALRNATEEDERTSAEQEFRRADEKRQEREQQKHKAREDEPSQDQHVIALKGAATVKVSSGSSDQPEPKPDVPPQRLATAPGPLSTRRGGLNRKVIVAGTVVLLIAGVFVVWMLTRNKGIATDGPPQQSALKPTDNPLITSPTSVTPAAGTVLRNKIGMELVFIPAGIFMMGSTKGDADEKPEHQVNIERPFYIGKYEVTQAQWRAVMGDNPSSFKNCGTNCPVENISWDDATEFIRRLNEMNDGLVYRLPSEAEWEYACRAGTTGEYAGDWKEMAWFSENSENRTHAVGQKQSNAWGLADMHGNVWEWCEDWYHETYYGAPTNGSAWVSGGEQKVRVMRGGSWVSDPAKLRTVNRNFLAPATRTFYFGLRVVAIVR